MTETTIEPNDPTTTTRFSRLEAVWEQYGSYGRSAFMLVVFFATLWLLRLEFQSMRYADVVASFRSLTLASIAAAIALTAANYVVLIGYDWFGVKLVDHPVSGKQVATAALLSYAFSNSLGVFLGGAPVRARLYSSWGMPPNQIVRLVLMIGIGFWLGVFALAGTLFVVAPFEIPAKLQLPVATSGPLGIVLLVLVTSILVILGLRRTPLRIWGFDLQLPPLRIAIAQLLVAVVDFTSCAAVLYVLLPDDIQIEFFAFVAVFLLAVFVALISHVPGGLGVLELVLITMLPESSHGLVGSLVAFRIIYYLLPLAIAMVAVSILSARQHREKIGGALSFGIDWVSVVSTRIITGAVFVAGALLLISGALPSTEGRLAAVQEWLPLPAIEISHFLASIIGATLLVLGRALQRRIDAAYYLTLGLLAAAVIVSLMKGFDYHLAIALTLLLVALLPCKKYFYRHGRLLSPGGDPAWFAAVAMTVGSVIWLIFFSYQHVEYEHDLWWSFTYQGHASRSLRAAVGAAVVLMMFLLVRLLGTKQRLPELPDEQQMSKVNAIVATDERADGNLALLGDKRFIFSDDDQAFVMFGTEGNSWISMGDPIGLPGSSDDAAWKFVEACDQQGVWPVFYQVSHASLGRYIEMGMSMIKLGEEARVPLADYSLASCSRNVRRVNKKSIEMGLSFQVVPGKSISEWMPQLKAISDAWLGEKSTAEKGFSLGFFEESYLSNFDFALIMQDEKPVAFANIWKAADGTEVSPDLMRYYPDAPRGVMEFLFVQMMLWGKEQGYAWFSLGMAPLSGVESRRLGPTWNRVSSLVYRHGEHFYNFQGLRAYKDKFHPQWFPRYLASPGGIATPQILTNVSTLISGGLVGLIKR